MSLTTKVFNQVEGSVWNDILPPRVSPSSNGLKKCLLTTCLESDQKSIIKNTIHQSQKIARIFLSQVVNPPSPDKELKIYLLNYYYLLYEMYKYILFQIRLQHIFFKIHLRENQSAYSLLNYTFSKLVASSLKFRHINTQKQDGLKFTEIHL